ncbi:zinc-ribbon domain-containing protein [uncultured Croceicoccus sp.]|uniref:zinc-ribbon domain-containing protein n=1 Tax=uncultured Croceicoccus sp. TaxID=1295329 RepID=UPI002620F34F|nr:zinc-ribbon domain-containing protein [uncultured Croceicoccus sp.]
MLIACPACQTRYDVPPGALGENGRTVRCAQCGNSWFAAPDGIADPAPVAADNVGADTAGVPDSQADSAAPAPAEPETDGANVGADESVPDPVDVPSRDTEWDEESTPAAAPPRARWQLWLIAALGVAAIAAAIYGTARLYGLPDWAPGANSSFAAAPENLDLDFPDKDQILQTTEDGARFFTASGRIVNTGSSARRVPPIQVILRDSQERIVYSVEMIAPKSVLEPGESIALREAMTDIPRSARVVEIGWKSL